MGSVGAPWLVFVVAATWRWERTNGRSLPRPGIYVGSGVVFGALALASQSERARPVAVAAAWALVVAELIGGQLLTGKGTGSLWTATPPAGVGGPSGLTTPAPAGAGKPSPTRANPNPGPAAPTFG